MNACGTRPWVWSTVLIAVALAATSCRVSFERTSSTSGGSAESASTASPFRPTVLADQGPDGSPLLALKGEPSDSSRTEPTEIRAWTDRTITVDNVTFDKFEIRRADTMLAFFSLCQPINICSATTDLALNTCTPTTQADRTSCHVASTRGHPYELSLLEGNVTIAEATAAADIADAQR